MNEQDLDPADTELSARIATYELAFRMQSAAPEAVDLSRESDRTKAMYGLDDAAHGRVRHALPAGPPAGRARRAVRAALFGRRAGRHAVGRPRRHRRQPREDVRPDRQAGRRAAHRPEADRPARRDPGRLGRRVRPDAGAPARGPGPRSQRHRLHDVDGRRRRQGGHDRRRDRRDRPARPSRTAPTSTTSTPRSCT